MISILEREIHALNTESATRDNMLAILLKPPTDGEPKQDKVSVLLQVGFKYLKLCNKMFTAQKLQEGKLILDFMQRSVNQIYLSSESYLWSLLKIRLIITRLHYLELRSKYSGSNQNGKKNGSKNGKIDLKNGKMLSKKQKYEKLGFQSRIHLFCQQIVRSSHCKQIESDFYSQIEIIYFYGIESLLKKMEKKVSDCKSKTNKDYVKEDGQMLKDDYAHLKEIGIQISKKSFTHTDIVENGLHKNIHYKAAKQLIIRTRNSLSEQLQRLCEQLKFQQKKVYKIIQRKCEFLIKIYAIELLILKTIEGQTSIRSQHRLWKKYYSSILFKVPNRIQPKEIQKIIAQIFQKKFPLKSKEPGINFKQNPMSEQSVSLYSMEDQTGILEKSGQVDDIKFVQGHSIGYIPSKSIINQQSKLSMNPSKGNKNSERSMKKINFHKNEKQFFYEVFEEERENQFQSSAQESNDKKSSNKTFSSGNKSFCSEEEIEEDLNTEKKMCLENLQNFAAVMKPRYNNKNRFLSIQYRPSLLASMAFQQKKQQANYAQSSKKVTLTSQVESVDTQTKNYSFSHTFKCLRNNVTKNGKIGGNFFQSEIFKSSTNKIYRSLPQKSNIRPRSKSFQPKQLRQSCQSKMATKQNARLGDILGNILEERPKRHVSLPNVKGKSHEQKEITLNNAERETEKTKRKINFRSLSVEQKNTAHIRNYQQGQSKKKPSSNKMQFILPAILSKHKNQRIKLKL